MMERESSSKLLRYFVFQTGREEEVLVFSPPPLDGCAPLGLCSCGSHTGPLGIQHNASTFECDLGFEEVENMLVILSFKFHLLSTPVA